MICGVVTPRRDDWPTALAVKQIERRVLGLHLDSMLIAP